MCAEPRHLAEAAVTAHVRVCVCVIVVACLSAAAAIVVLYSVASHAKK